MNTPLVATLVANLTERIASGEYRDRFPSHRELVREYDVSRSVVIKVLASLEKAGLIIQSPRCRTVVRNLPSSSLPLTESETTRKTIGLWIWPGPTDPGMAALVQGIGKALSGTAYRIMIDSAIWDSWEAVCDSEQRFIECVIQDRDTSGILLWYLGGKDNLPALQKARAAGIPMVFVDRRPPEGFDADYVGIDNVMVADKVVRHLVSLKHRRIAFITNQDHASTVVERFEGYRRGLERAHLSFDPALVFTAGEASEEEGKTVYGAILDQLLALPEAPTAVFAVNDLTAHRFLAAVASRGLRVPDDLAVASIDGTEGWFMREPFLTSIYQPFETIGQRAVDLLLHRIAVGPNAPYRHLEIDAPLRVFGSTKRKGV